MRQLASFCAIGVLALSVGCGSHDDVVAPNQWLYHPGHGASLTCEASPDECAQIQRGIDYLRGHANPMCRLAGQNAQDRYDATSGAGFRDAPQQPGFDMGVLQNPFPSNGYTDVYPSFWNRNWGTTETGALIAHEEIHHLGMDEPEANRTQDACLNAQP